MDSGGFGRSIAAGRRPGMRLFALTLGGLIAFLIGGLPAIGAYLVLAAIGGLLARLMSRIP